MHKYTKKNIKKNIPAYASTPLYNAHDQINLYTNTDGTRLALMPNKSDASSINIMFYFKNGSKFESIDLNGISHYVEHMVYKGGSNLKTYFDIVNVIKNIIKTKINKTHLENYLKHSFKIYN